MAAKVLKSQPAQVEKLADLIPKRPSLMSYKIGRVIKSFRGLCSHT